MGIYKIIGVAVAGFFVYRYLGGSGSGPNKPPVKPPTCSDGCSLTAVKAKFVAKDQLASPTYLVTQDKCISVQGADGSLTLIGRIPCSQSLWDDFGTWYYNLPDTIPQPPYVIPPIGWNGINCKGDLDFAHPPPLDPQPFSACRGNIDNALPCYLVKSDGTKILWPYNSDALREYLDIILGTTCKAKDSARMPPESQIQRQRLEDPNPCAYIWDKHLISKRRRVPFY